MKHEEQHKRFMELVEPVKDETEWNGLFVSLYNLGFFDAPAFTKYHGNCKGGLFEHSYWVTAALVNLTKRLNLSWERKISPYIVGLFHDLCKCDQYRASLVANQYEYRTDTQLTGHGDKSVMIASTLTRLTEEEVMCIRYHMGEFTDKEEWAYYTRAVKIYPNVLYTHTADMIVSHILNA